MRRLPIVALLALAEGLQHGACIQPASPNLSGVRAICQKSWPSTTLASITQGIHERCGNAQLFAEATPCRQPIGNVFGEPAGVDGAGGAQLG